MEAMADMNQENMDHELEACYKKYKGILKNIYAYLETVLLYMPDYKNEPEGIEELLPWSDMIQQRCRIKSKS